jgi:hypothetical protein
VAARVAVAGLLAATGASASAAVYNESASGDLSGDWLAPTTWLLDAKGNPGADSHAAPATFSNLLIGSVGGGNTSTPDRDYVHIVVPRGYALSALMVGRRTEFGSSRSFIGLASGKFIDIDPTKAADATGLLGFMLYGKDERGTDILDEMAAGPFGSSGFERPLKAGDYTVWIQELARGSYNYQFDFVLTAVPEPATMALWAAGLGMVGVAAARRRQPRGDAA